MKQTAQTPRRAKPTAPTAIGNPPGRAHFALRRCSSARPTPVAKVGLLQHDPRGRQRQSDSRAGLADRCTSLGDFRACRRGWRPRTVSDDPRIETSFVAGAANVVPDEVEDFFGTRLQNSPPGIRRAITRAACGRRRSPLPSVPFFVRPCPRAQVQPHLRLTFSSVGHGRPQSDGDVVGEVIAPPRLDDDRRVPAGCPARRFMRCPSSHRRCPRAPRRAPSHRRSRPIRSRPGARRRSPRRGRRPGSRTPPCSGSSSGCR